MVPSTSPLLQGRAGTELRRPSGRRKLVFGLKGRELNDGGSSTPATETARGADGAVRRTPALFATAYGNVGSSIYYALGLTAVFALGLTPLVFVVAGIVFAATAATYAEGTVRFPEAGGSSSFARHGFDELVSVRGGLVADARPHRHDRDVGVLRPVLPLDLLGAAAVEPVGHRRGGGGDRGARLAQRGRGHEAARLSIGLAVIDSARRRCCRARLRARLHPEALVVNVHGDRADVGEPRVAIPVAMLAYTGAETCRTCRGGTRARGKCPERVQARRGRCLRDLLHASAHRALGTAG